MIKIDFNELRVNLTRYCKEHAGEKIYLTRYNVVVGEIKFYTEEQKAEAEVEMAQNTLSKARDRNIKKITRGGTDEELF